MNKNLDLVAKELYAKISSYPNLVMKDPEGNDVETDQVEGARKFNFEYEVDGKNLATITISLNDDSENQDSFEVLISNDPAEGADEYAKKMFLNFGREMREFAKQHMLTFNIHVATRSNKERDTGDSIMSESKLFGTARTSYQRIGEATLIIKHRDVVNQENPAGRAQRIESIYVENAQGERFKYPFRHLNGARAMAQHVAHGGNPYDGIGQYMVGLSEEMNRLRMFKSYVERNEMVSEAMGTINSKVMERIEQVKREIQHLQRPTAYQEFAESFTESEAVEIPEDVMNDWIDRLTVRTFNEELKNVFPYIFKLVSEDDIPVKEVGVEDLVSEDGSEEDEDDKEANESVIPEFAEYEQYLARLTESEQEGIFAAENEDAIAELNELLASPMPLGVDGTNAIQSLEGLGFDSDFLNGLKKMASDETGEGMDARPFVKEYIQQKDAELGTDVLSQLTFGDDNEIAADSPEPVAPEPAADVMPDAEAPPELPPEEPEAEVPPEELPMPPAPVAEAMMRAERSRMFDELKEFIHSMYNEDEGNFPKGVEGVKIACEKKFGDRVGPIAAKIVERMTSMGEMARMRKLSGLSEGPFTGIGKMMMKHKLKKGIKKDRDSEDDAFDNMHDYDFSNPDRFGHEDDFVKAHDAKRRKEKALDRLSREGVAESYPKHQDLSGISTDKLKSYLDKQSQKQGSGEGNQIKRVRSELQRREKTVTELSKNTLGKYVKAAAKDAEDAGRDQEYHGHKNDYARGEKRQKGIGKAVDRLTKESTITELEKKTLQSYKSKALNDIDSAAKDIKGKNAKTVDANKVKNRVKGVQSANDRLKKESSELTAMLRIAGLR